VHLTAIFEEWLLGDGCYPALHRDQLVNLAFQVRPTAPVAELLGAERFQSLPDGTCRVGGTLLQVYPTVQPPVAVLEAEGFRCYLQSPEVAGWPRGSRVAAEGTLAVDYYIWSESLADRYVDAPNLFYPLRVTRIRCVWIPEQFITRTERSVTSPAMVPLDEVAPEDIEEVETMLEPRRVARGAPLAEYAPAFFLVDLSDEGLPPGEIPHTHNFHRSARPRATDATAGSP